MSGGLVFPHRGNSLALRRDGLTPESVWAVIEAASVKLQLKPEEAAHIGGKGAGSEVMDLQVSGSFSIKNKELVPLGWRFR